MRQIPKAIYQTVEEIEARIAARELDAAHTPEGSARQSILKEIAQLRVYAEAKRWIESPDLKAPRSLDRKQA